MAVTTAVVVSGDLITAAYGNGIRTDLLDLQSIRNDMGPHQLRFVPAGNLDAAAGAWTDWLAVGNVTVPAAATAAVIVVAVNRILASTTGLPEYLLRCRIGTVSEVNSPGTLLMPAAATTVPESVGFVSYVVSPPVGLQSVAIQTSRVGTGTGAIRATTSTIASVGVHFRG